MSEAAGGKLTNKNLKPDKKKKVLKLDSKNSNKSSKSLIKKLHIGKVYKVKKKIENKFNKQSTTVEGVKTADMTESQETLCSMEEESSLTQPVSEMQDQQPPALSEKQPKGDDQVKEDESIPTASEISTQTLSDHEVESDGETAKESTPESEEVEEEEEEDQNDAPVSGEYFSSLPSMENEVFSGSIIYLFIFLSVKVMQFFIFSFFVFL